MSSELEVSVSEMEGNVPVSILRVCGKVDASNVGQLEDRAMGLVDSGTGHLLFDLSGLDFMSSAGFRAIHKVYQAMHPDGGSGNLKIANASENIQHLIRTLGFDKFVPLINGDIGEAVASF